ncbi:two-component system, NtrC family, response regulator [Granulicella pectinivorans]|jgi:two-component system NtrC family response regulator|uniref:Two-component system, NtrC family, response regulator n=1 Tax=Granulicella pectinivorans TaxID=474950 RepID=A0A1I6MPL1_9BACT|nr:sigma-54 dependent transcriptional regulator [Granulicella pectinivorans]SFS17551.1 two-component system, NtrC family, response regulator [Granulicella pectinivorans]
MKRNHILVVDDDSSLRRVMKMQLEEAGYVVSLATDGNEGWKMLQETEPYLVITDLRMPTSGLELLGRITREGLQTTVIVVTAFGTVETAVEAMKLGAYDYVMKPLDFDALLLVVHRAMERQNLIEEVRTLRSALDQRYGFEGIVGHSKSFLRVLDQAARVAQRDTTVLIQGETGTGKELLARAIHHNSRRRNRPFVAINCGAIPRELVESELFGYTRGAFTGALTNKTGRIESADGGTLFLDEVGELPLEAQVKLLRVLQEGELPKLGANSQVKVDVRVIAATHRNLPAMVEDETFREDLYYRLAVVPLLIPPLRERREDLPELIDSLLERAKTRHGLEDVRLSPAVKRRLIAYRWPGNVRQVENVLERLLVLSASDLITDEDLPEELMGSSTDSTAPWRDLPEEGISLEAIERDLISRALEKFSGNQTHAARYLDISRRTLIYRMEKHGLMTTDPEPAL